MFAVLSMIILVIIIIALLMNYFLCRSFHSCWKETARANWQVMGKPDFSEFYQNQLGFFRPITLGSRLDHIGSHELLAKRAHLRWSWLTVLAMLFSACALVGFEADFRPAKSVIIPIESIKL